MAKAIVFERINKSERKRGFPSFAYPLIEVLRKPLLSNKQSRNPRRVYIQAHVYLNNTRGRIVHPMGIYATRF